VEVQATGRRHYPARVLYYAARAFVDLKGPVKTNKPLYDWSVFFSDANNGAAMQRTSHPEAKEAFEILKSMSATAQYLAQIPQRPPCGEGLSVNTVQR